MHKNTRDYLINCLNIDGKIIDLCLQCEEEIKDQLFLCH